MKDNELGDNHEDSPYSEIPQPAIEQELGVENQSINDGHEDHRHYVPNGKE
jgi:hypothetical protein